MNTVKRLWNKNFAILWQGQLISDFGNAAFAVALGFWVLQATATPALPGGDLRIMGKVEMAFLLPGILAGPFAGALADRLSRKWLIVLADLMRGLLFAAMGALLLLNIFPFGLIYPLAILESLAGSLFSPAMSSAVPDIVPEKDLSRANSARSFSQSATQLLGSGLGGWLFSVIRAPALIFFNGLSFLYAAITQLFMKIPSVRRTGERKRVLADLLDGLKYTFGMRGIRTLVFTGMFINLFAGIGFTLLTPLFKNTVGFGVERYGYVMCALLAGSVSGMVVLSIVRVKAGMRARLFCGAMLVMACTFVPFGFLNSVPWMYPLAFVGGATNAAVNMMLQTVMQTAVPAQSRGRVFGILGTLVGGLQPLAMFAGGYIAFYLGVRPTILAAFSALVLAVLPLLFDRGFQAFINQADKSVEASADADVPLRAESPNSTEDATASAQATR